MNPVTVPLALGIIDPETFAMLVTAGGLSLLFLTLIAGIVFFYDVIWGKLK
jgi:hypothetical protein